MESKSPFKGYGKIVQEGPVIGAKPYVWVGKKLIASYKIKKVEQARLGTTSPPCFGRS